MKYLIWLLIVFVGIWWIRQQRQSRQGSAQTPTKPSQPTHPTVMVSCAHCGAHVPEDEAIRGQHGGVYCSQAHRRSQEG